MDFEMLVRSAHSLRPTFAAIAARAFQMEENRDLREDLSELGRNGECVMLQTTNGVNTHRGAIWTLGLRCAGATVIAEENPSAAAICAKASRIACLPDSFTSLAQSHGQRAFREYGARGAREEAEEGFQHVLNAGLPMLRQSISEGLSTVHARLNALTAIMADLDDTCVLHRGGPAALRAAKRGARNILDCGGVSKRDGFEALHELHHTLLRLNASPGGSADLLAAVLFLGLGRTRYGFSGGAGMETIHFQFPAGPHLLSRKAHVGVVASGNLEILLEPEFSTMSKVRVRTSVVGFREEWLAVLQAFFARHRVAAAIEINDGGASPPIVMLRLEQALKESCK